MTQLASGLLVLTLIWGNWIFANDAMTNDRVPLKRLHIQSKSDRFEVLFAENAATVNGKPVDMAALRNILPLLTNPLAEDCPEVRSASDVKVRVDGEARQIYIEQGLVSDGKKCIKVEGEGLVFFPVHRDFLIGPKSDSIVLKSPVKITRPNLKPLEIEKSGSAWIAVGNDWLVNWDFIERFESSLKSFSVRYRVLDHMTKDKPKFTLKSGTQTYEFYKISQVLWAVRKPGLKWLVASDDWSFWYELEDGLLEDRSADQIRLIQDPKQDLPVRLSTLEKIETLWSRNLRDLYHKLVLNPAENPQIQEIALRRLKTKPAMETALVMAQILSSTKDENFKRTVSQILKLNHNKGPIYDPNAPLAARLKVVDYWSEWLKKRTP